MINFSAKSQELMPIIRSDIEEKSGWNLCMQRNEWRSFKKRPLSYCKGIDQPARFNPRICFRNLYGLPAFAVGYPATKRLACRYFLGFLGSAAYCTPEFALEIAY